MQPSMACDYDVEIINLQRRIFCSDCDSLGNTEFKNLTDLNFTIVVNTQITLLQTKTQPDKTECSRQ